jgi:hypothetical protein
MTLHIPKAGTAVTRLSFVICASLLFGTALFGKDDPWAKVTELRNRAELRIYKKGVAEPVNAVFFEATDERLIAVVKNAQVSFAKEDIDRVDARPAAAGKKKVAAETKVKTDTPDTTPRPPHGVDVPRDSWSGGVSFGGSKADFETIYRRQSAK